MHDDTLDGLLLTLTMRPTDTAQIGIIADYLDQIDHPAAAWWRDSVLSVYNAAMTIDRQDWYIERVAWQHEWDGYNDLCAILDRVTREAAIHA